ncbi:MAG: MFS transporter [Verrucomicrobiales bacterium]
MRSCSSSSPRSWAACRTALGAARSSCSRCSARRPNYLLLAWAPTLAWLFVARIISGITSANISAASAYIADVTPPEKRAAGFGMIGAAFGLGFIAGPAIGGWLGEFGLRVMGDEGIRLPFYAAAAVTFANALYGAFVLPESLAPENRRDFSWRRANPFAALKALARWPVVAGMAATHFFINLAHNIYPALWVLYTGYRFGWGPKEVGTSLAAVGIMAALVQGGLAGRIVGAIGERRGLVLGLLATALALAGYGLAPAGWMIYAIIVAGSLGGIANPSAQTIITKAVDADQQGAVQGALGSIASIASIAAPLLWTNLFRFGISEGGSASLAPFHFPGIAFLAAAATTLGAIFLAKRAFAQVDRSAAAEAET